MTTKRALIAGLGLIGGSIGKALRMRGWQVAYVDPSVEEDQARRAAAADQRLTSIEAGADIVIIATPVDAALQLMATMPAVRATSVCSVMQPLREAAGRRGLTFVSGHPLAGSHERSLAAARADLFEGRPWFVDQNLPEVSAVIAACGAREEVADAAEHDRAVAITSHLPQILSTALAASLEDEMLRFAGSGLRTFLRLAASDASVWRPLIEANRENIARHEQAVGELVRRIIRGDSGDAFEKAQRIWRELDETADT
jgi:prephenate dehydrogenase